MQGYHFTQRVRKVLAMSREEAQQLGHEYVGTEHILLGLVREDEATASTILQDLGVSRDNVRSLLLTVVVRGRGQHTFPDLPYTSRAKKVLELAMAEARQIRHSYVGTEHLLLGLLAESKGIAAQVLMDLGCTLEKAREAMLRIIADRQAERRGTEDSSDFPQVASGGLTPVSRSKVEFVEESVPSRFFRIVRDAQFIGVRLNHISLTADHLLLALLEHGEGSAIAVLERLGVSLPELHRELEAKARAFEKATGPDHVIDASAIDDVLTRSRREQIARSNPVSTSHLLLAILDTQSSAADLLTKAGVTRERVSAEAARISG
jgi:ATP-dependent Clp protease ATP-binding subunit ClpA